MNTLGTVVGDRMTEIPDDMQVTYPKAMKYLGSSNARMLQNAEDLGEEIHVRVNRRPEQHHHHQDMELAETQQ